MRVCLRVFVSFPHRARTLLWDVGIWKSSPACCPHPRPAGAASLPRAWSGLHPTPGAGQWRTSQVLSQPQAHVRAALPRCAAGEGYLAGQQAGADLFGLWIYHPTLPVEVALLPCRESGPCEPPGNFQGAHGRQAGPEAKGPPALQSEAAGSLPERDVSGRQRLFAGHENHPRPHSQPRHSFWGLQAPNRACLLYTSDAADEERLV